MDKPVLYLIVLSCFGLVAGLALSYTIVTVCEITVPSGKPGFSIGCSPASMNDCSEKANQLCPKGYTTVGQQGSQSLGWYWYGGGTVIPMPFSSRNVLVVECI
jgi:hypothetical protein